MSHPPVRLGLGANRAQFTLLVALTGLVGAMVGLERAVLPLIGRDEFGLESKGAVLSFIVAFGLAKACANLTGGPLAERSGRRRTLALGWALALPVPALIAWAPTWGVVVAANALLGASQGLAWSMTVLMKVDLVGPRRRGLALGLNESAGYLGVATAAFATGALAASFAPRTVVWTLSAAVAAAGMLATLFLVRETSQFATHEQAARPTAAEASLVASMRASLLDPLLRSCTQAGFVNNANDALAWGLVPLYLASHGADAAEIGAVAAAYPLVWAVAQLPAGWVSDSTGRKPLIVAGTAAQGGALLLLIAAAGDFVPALIAAAALGLGTAFAYPTLLAAVADAVEPRARAHALSVYRFWRDIGLVAGALLTGFVADALGNGGAIASIAVLTVVSALWLAGTRWRHVIGPRRTSYRLR